MMNIRVLGDRVLVLRDDPEQKTAGGLFVPEQAQGKTTRGTVVGRGNKVEDVLLGDYVMFSRSAGVDLSYNGTDFLILREEDVIGVFTDDN